MISSYPFCSPALLITGEHYFNSVLKRRREAILRQICKENAAVLSETPGGCVVLVHPTDLTERLLHFSETDKHVHRCIDILWDGALDPTALIVAGLRKKIQQDSDDDENDDDEREDDARQILKAALQLRRMDAILDGLHEKGVIYGLERFMLDALLDLERFGWVPIVVDESHRDGQGEKEDSEEEGQLDVQKKGGKNHRLPQETPLRPPRIPKDYVVVRLQPSGEYVCRDLEGRICQLHLLRPPSAREEPTSDLRLLLSDFESMEVLREAHRRAVNSASRPFVVSAKTDGDADTASSTLLSSIGINGGTRGSDKNGGVRGRHSGGGASVSREGVFDPLRDSRIQGIASVFRTEGLSSSADGQMLTGELATGPPLQRTVQQMYDHLLREKVANHKKRKLDRETIDTLQNRLQKVVTDDTAGENGPLRYQLPEGVQHVESNLGVRPNAFNYEVRERLFEVQVEGVMLDRDANVDNAGAAETRQGVGRALVAAVDASGVGASGGRATLAKCRQLQKFFVDEVLKSWLQKTKLPMATTTEERGSGSFLGKSSEGGGAFGGGEGGGSERFGNCSDPPSAGSFSFSSSSLSPLPKFDLFNAILKRRSLVSWLLVSTGLRAADIDFRRAIEYCRHRRRKEEAAQLDDSERRDSKTTTAAKTLK